MSSSDASASHSVQVVLAADCSAVTSRMYVTYVRHVCVTTHALNRGDRACALRHVFFFLTALVLTSRVFKTRKFDIIFKNNVNV